MLWNVQKNILQNMEIRKISDKISSHLKPNQSSLVVATKIREAARMCKTYNEYVIFTLLTETFLGITIKDIIKENVEFDERSDEYYFKG